MRKFQVTRDIEAAAVKEGRSLYRWFNQRLEIGREIMERGKRGGLEVSDAPVAGVSPSVLPPPRQAEANEDEGLRVE